MIIKLLSNLEWGTVPDWLGAIGTIAAVFIAIYLPYQESKLKGKVYLEETYFTNTPNSIFTGFTVNFFNVGSKAINVQSLRIGIKGYTQQILISTDFNGMVTQSGEGIQSGMNGASVYDGIKMIAGSDKNVKLFPCAIDSLGNVYTGKSEKFNMEKLNNSLSNLRYKYYHNTEAAKVDEETIFKTCKLD